MTHRVRVRFAPSPTGFLHVGGLRTALFNYLFARKNEGVFVLRIEDTDRARYVEGAVEGLVDTLHWAGLTYDEGPGKGGPHGPYIQSQRIDVYRAHASQLLEGGKAYRCFCTPERLEEMRKEFERRKIPPKYDRTCLRLSAEEVRRNLDGGKPFVIRMKIPEARTVAFDDLIRERVEFLSDRLDDQVLIKSDGYPTYHLANVVDDHLMGISHVIRGEEWISSTPKHILLYEYFGWEVPRFAHLPLLLNPDRSKLSKRQGDIAVEDYRERGFLPEALVNFVALLGWNPGDQREVFTLEQLIHEFTLERVGKAGAIFNLEKLKWLNEQHLRSKSDAELAELVQQSLTKHKLDGFSDDYLRKVVALMKERVVTVEEFVTYSPYFFKDPQSYEAGAIRKNWGPEARELMEQLLRRWSALSDFSHSAAESSLRQLAQDARVSAGKIIHPVRLALTGVAIGPGLFELIDVLGKETVLRRLQRALDALP